MEYQSSSRLSLGVVVFLLMCLIHEGFCDSHLPSDKITNSPPEGGNPLPFADHSSNHQRKDVATPPVANHNSGHRLKGITPLPAAGHHVLQQLEDNTSLPVAGLTSTHQPKGITSLPANYLPSSHLPKGITSLPEDNHPSSHQQKGITTLPVDYSSSHLPKGTTSFQTDDLPSSHQSKGVTSLPVTGEYSSHHLSVKPLPRYIPEDVKLSKVITQLSEESSQNEFPIPSDGTTLYMADNHAITAKTKKSDGSVKDNVSNTMIEYNQLNKGSIVVAEGIRNLARNFSIILKSQPHVASDPAYDNHVTRTPKGKQLSEGDLPYPKDLPKECEDASENLKNIVVTAKIAISKFDEFKDDFASDKFSDSQWQDVLSILGNMDFGIQPNIPAVEDNAVLTEEMVKVYHQLQQHVVGLENATLDQIIITVSAPFADEVADNSRGTHLGAEFYLEHFTELIAYLEELLIYTMKGMEDLGVVPEGTQTLETVRQQYTILDETLKDYRDFTVLRKYEEGLQHIINVFTSICPNIST